ncbi:DsbA family protein [Demequina sp. TTPB684]|uniref:DsbA family protein n=1 Tax=unclassified Demequina TaxID=2620311 RepID=UPI001CF3CD92|nr:MULTISPECIES: thioredoxin domain-containing protein [unclassified Demequina]MCB2412816.1 DsbA family protein [Demequina sp. TTPB684]UPU87452.1 DsbA family protein [Demequina sp. TMPB413]
MAKNVQGSDKVADAKKKAQAQVRAQERRTALIWVVVGVVVVALFAALVSYVVRQGQVADVGSGDQLTPAVATENGGFPIGTSGVVGEELDDSRVQVDVYLDFMCPICGVFEESQGPVLEQLREDGTADVYYHPISILDRYSQDTEFSTRSASAAALIAQESPENFLNFVEAMFLNQPAENTTGLTDAEIQEIARVAGVPDDVVAKIPDHAYAAWVRSATEQASIDGMKGTPSIAINGEMQDPRANPDDLNWTEPGALLSAVQEAANE